MDESEMPKSKNEILMATCKVIICIWWGNECKILEYDVCSNNYCRSTNVRALLMFSDFAVWQKTRTLIAREHLLQLLNPIY